MINSCCYTCFWVEFEEKENENIFCIVHNCNVNKNDICEDYKKSNSYIEEE